MSWRELWMTTTNRPKHKESTGQRAWFFHRRTVWIPGSCIFLDTTPNIYITNWDLMFSICACTTTRMVCIGNWGLTSQYTEEWSILREAKAESLPWHHSIAITFAPCYNLPWGRLSNFSELFGAISTPWCGLWSGPHEAGSWSWIRT